MNETQQLLTAYNDLEAEMKRFSTLVKEVMASITMQEFVPEKVNTDMMQCIMELNKKEKEVFKLYKQAELGETVPKKMRVMREQIEKNLNEQRKIDYLEAVKKSFLSLYTEDPEVEKALQSFKDKIVTIKVEKYSLEQCLVYIRPFAVFLTMIKSDDPVKSFEQVPILMEYFGSELVAHITVSKDIHIGEDATEFSLEGEDEPVSAKESMMQGSKQPVQTAESKKIADEVVSYTAKQAEKAKAEAASEKAKEEAAEIVEEIEPEEETKEVEAPVAKAETVKKEVKAKRPAKPTAPKKVDLKALLEEDNFSEDKLDDPELKQMKENNGKKDSSFLKIKTTGSLGGPGGF